MEKERVVHDLTMFYLKNSYNMDALKSASAYAKLYHNVYLEIADELNRLEIKSIGEAPPWTD